MRLFQDVLCQRVGQGMHVKHLLVLTLWSLWTDLFIFVRCIPLRLFHTDG